MARRRRGAMPPPPAGGGYEFEVIELGAPAYLTPPPEVVARGGLIPAGDGEALGARPAPPGEATRKRRVHQTSAPDQPQPGDGVLSFEVNFELALSHQATGDFASAQGDFERAVALARAINDARRAATALHALGRLLQELDRPAEALQLVEEAVALAESARDPRLLAGALLSQGSLLRRLGRAPESARVLERAREIVSNF